MDNVHRLRSDIKDELAQRLYEKAEGYYTKRVQLPDEDIDILLLKNRTIYALVVSVEVELPHEGGDIT